MEMSTDNVMARVVRKRKIGHFCLLFTVFCLICVVKNAIVKQAADDRDLKEKNRQYVHIGHFSSRRMLTESNNESCVQPAILEFPRDLLNNNQRLHGGLILHFIGALYMFCAITIICDDYFVPVLDVICDRCNLQSDVAGATFMALGSSAPELFASVIGVFVTKGDIGTGTILGSAVFNVLFVIGVCALFSGHVLKLSWWPIVRDLMSYLVALIALVLVIMDDVVQWYESLVMMCTYSFYLILMYFNPRIEKFLYRVTKTTKEPTQSSTFNEYTIVSPREPELLSSSELLHHTKENENDELKSVLMNDVNEMSESSKLITEQDEDEGIRQDASSNISSPDKGRGSRLSEIDAVVPNPFHPPKGKFQKLCWSLSLPLNVCFFYTIPDVRRQSRRIWYPLSFVVCIFWIAVTSYGLVWMVTVIGYTLGLPDTVMGLTLVAFGSSVPDCISSLIVAKKGDGDMACSHTVGSNVFDILLCLGIPWTIKTLLTGSKSSIDLNSHGLFISSFFIMASILLTFLMMHYYEWTLTRTVGVTYIIVYVIFISIACIIELNVFGQFNPPMCELSPSY